VRSFHVVVSATAERHIAAIGEWWCDHRPAAPDLFREELEAALALLERSPTSGSPYPVAKPKGTRRKLLPRTRYHVYYTFDDEKREVIVRAVWHAMRGSGPRL